MGTCFVTGGNGFVGSHLVEALSARGEHVRALARDPERLRWLSAAHADLIPGDLCHREDLHDVLVAAMSGVGTVYHIAALTRARTERDMLDVNVGGTEVLLRAAAAHTPSPRFVFLSSQAAWGPSRNGIPADETTEPRPVSSYGRSKLAAEAAVSDYAERTGAGVVIVRAPAVYGPRDAAFAVLFQQAMRRILPRLPGSRRLSIVHVRDLVDGLVRAGERGDGIYTFTDGPPHSLDELLDGISAAVGKSVWKCPLPVPVYVAAVWAWEQVSRLTGTLPPYTTERARESAAPDWACSDACSRAELGYHATITLEAGLRETAGWYRTEGWLS